jgi:hypothetical protein
VGRVLEQANGLALRDLQPAAIREVGDRRLGRRLERGPALAAHEQQRDSGEGNERRVTIPER